MRFKLVYLIILSLLITTQQNYAQGFENAPDKSQTFKFSDPNRRNQVSFESKAPLEDIFGTSNDITGKVELNLTNLKSIKGEFEISVSSLKTGIDLRDQHIRDENWLDAKKYPTIKLIIKQIKKLDKIEQNKYKIVANVDFSVKGVVKNFDITAEMTYMPESDITKTRFPGDLLVIRSEFNIKLSDYGVKNNIIGQKVAEEILIKANLVGSNKI